MWKKTDTKEGIRAAEDIICPQCGSKMLLHFSTIHTPVVATGTSLLTVYKCFRCNLIQYFEHPVDKEFAEQVRNKRKGGDLYIPWSPEHGEGGMKEMEEVYTSDEQRMIKERLKSLGYI